MPRRAPGSSLRPNRIDTLLPKPAVDPAGQPNGRPVASQVMGHLPYGERGKLTAAIGSTPGQPSPPRPPRGRPMPPPPTDQDLTGGQGFESALQSVGGWTPPQMTSLTAPTERPDEHPMTGAIGRPDSILPPAPVGNVADQLRQVAAITGSGALAGLATRLAASGN